MPLTRLEKTPRWKLTLLGVVRILGRSLRSLAIVFAVVLLMNVISQGFESVLNFGQVVASNRGLIGLIVAVIVGWEIWNEVRHSGR